ncbi:MAG: Lar family restriction alleviation protein [Atopobiaceae bacterium]|nr:Lar family restriction alleviation protein [Atopobiaceae bacterium]
MNEFEPCPFCGNTEGFQVKTVWKTYRFVACRCKAAGPVMPDDETAIEAWNTRVASGVVRCPEVQQDLHGARIRPAGSDGMGVR